MTRMIGDCMGEKERSISTRKVKTKEFFADRIFETEGEFASMDQGLDHCNIKIWSNIVKYEITGTKPDEPSTCNNERRVYLELI